MTDTLTCPTSVRLATPQDEPKLYYLLKGLEEDNFRGLPFASSLPISDQKLRHYITMACHGTGGWAGVVDGEENELVASTGIFAAQPWWSDEYSLSAHWLYVDPDYREGGDLAADLFKFGLWLRAEKSAEAGYQLPLETSVVSIERLPAKIRLWKRHARMIGAFFISDGK